MTEVDPTTTSSIPTENISQEQAWVAPQTVTIQNPELTEDYIADAFAAQFTNMLRFDHQRGKWFYWDDTRWRQDDTGWALDQARQLCRLLRKGKKQLSTKFSIYGVESLARSDQRLACTSDIWDSDPFLLGTPTGTINLKNGTLQEAKQLEFITKLTTVAPAAPNTPSPVFDMFLTQATGGDVGLRRFLQQWAGYCLTADTREQSLLFVYGPGGNGKTVFVNVLTEILGDYASTAAMQTFTQSHHQRHLTELAMLHGARLVNASETEQGQAWSESRINSFTGNEPITANFMRKDHFTYVPRFKLILIGNHMPKLASVNDAARRRFNIVPFNHKPHEPDKNLPEKLKAEYPAILRWMIEGCLDWQKNGLVRPSVVMNATAEYFEEQDQIGQWIKQYCDVSPTQKASASELFASWKAFAQANGESHGTAVTFASALTQHGYSKKKSGGLSVYIGISVKKNFTVGNYSDQM
jgi:putative DNA primase/helicase